MFLLTSAFRCIPISALAQANTLTTTKVDGECQPAEYTCQFQLAAKVAAIMRFALGELPYPRQGMKDYLGNIEAIWNMSACWDQVCHVVRREVTGTGERSRKRLDIFVGNGSVMRIGHELVVGFDQQNLDNHIQKSHAYAEDHDCVVWVVNFSWTSRDRAHTLKFSHSQGKVRSQAPSHVNLQIMVEQDSKIIDTSKPGAAMRLSSDCLQYRISCASASGQN